MRKSQFIFLFWFISLIFSCSKENNPAHRLTYALLGDPTSLDPAKSDDPFLFQIAPLIYETLVKFDKETFQIKPFLARSWEFDSRKLLWTFHLRTAVVFHDGSSFNSRAVKISFDRQLNPKSPYFSDSPPNIYSDFALNMIEKIEALNDSTVQFKLKDVYAPFLHVLTSPFGSAIVSPTALDKYGSNFSEHPVGTGPFQFVRWEKGKNIVLKRNKNYWGVPPETDLVFEINSELPRILDNLNQGTIDIFMDVAPIYLQEISFNSNLRILVKERLQTYFLGFNCSRPPLNKKKVREAILKALDIERIVMAFNRGMATVATSILPPTILKVNPKEKRVPDPERAKKLLLQAGYAQGLKVRFLVYSYSDRAALIPQVIKTYLEKIGIEVEIVCFDDWSAYNQALKQGEGELFLDGWTSNTGDADDFLYFLFHSKGQRNNLLHYQNATVDSLLELGRKMTGTLQQRQDIYRQVEAIIADEVPCIPIGHPKSIYILNKRVQNFVVNPLGIPQWEAIRVTD